MSTGGKAITRKGNTDGAIGSLKSGRIGHSLPPVRRVAGDGLHVLTHIRVLRKRASGARLVIGPIQGPRVRLCQVRSLFGDQSPERECSAREEPSQHYTSHLLHDHSLSFRVEIPGGIHTES